MAGEAVSMDTNYDEVDNYLESTSLDDDKFVYKMNYPKRGKFIIINNKTFHRDTKMGERSGTDIDAASLYKIFQKFGFEVTLKNNLTKDEMLHAMILASREDHSKSDCFGVAVLSHGDDGVLFGTDDVIAIDNFLEPIKRCRTLIGKPKIVLFQACRGSDLDSGQQSDAGGDKEGPGVALPVEADMLYGYSTVPGYFSWRNSTKGSWFVQALTQVLNKPESNTMEFVRVLTRASHVVAYQFESNASKPEMNKMKQVPSIVSMLTKDLYLRPK